MTVEYSSPAEGVGCIRLNRPRRLNAVTPELIDGILDGFDRADADGVRVIVLAGNGTAFCAGWDLKEPPIEETRDEARARLQRLQDVTRRTMVAMGLSNLISSLLGGLTVIPGGVKSKTNIEAGGRTLWANFMNACCLLMFALGCDLVIASQDAIFGFPEVDVGLSGTNAISALLPRMVGIMRAKELALLGERFDADRAFDLGLVTRVVPMGAHENAALHIAGELAAKPPVALRLAKRLLDEGMQSTVSQALDAEVDAALDTLDSGENAAAAESFRSR